MVVDQREVGSLQKVLHTFFLVCSLPGLAGARLWVVFPGGVRGKESTCHGRRHKRRWFHPWVGKIPWRRAWQLTPVFLSLRIPWTEKPGGLQTKGLQRVGHDWSDLACTHLLWALSAYLRLLIFLPTWFQLVIHLSGHFASCTLHRS